MEMGFGRNLLLVLAASVSTAFIAGCSGGVAGFASGNSTALSSSSATGAELEFQNSLWKFVNTQGCVKCHGSIVHPQFAASDLDTAYAAAKGTQIGVTTPLVDFSNPDASIFIVYAGNGHCNDTPCSDPSDRPAITAAIEAWAAAEVAAGNGGNSTAALPTYLTGGMPLTSSSLATVNSAAPTLVRFPLSRLNPSVASLGSAILEVQVQLINPTEYRFMNPRIEGNTAAVSIVGLHMFLNISTSSGVGSEDMSQGNGWDAIMASAAVVALPSPLSATTSFTATPLATTAVEAEVLSAKDVLTIGIDAIN